MRHTLRRRCPRPQLLYRPRQLLCPDRNSCTADSDSATTWLNAAGVTSPGSICSQGPSSNGKLYTAKQRITATLSGRMAAGQAMLLARVIDSF